MAAFASEMRLACGEEVVRLYVARYDDATFGVLVFHHFNGFCEYVRALAGKNGIAPIGVLFGFDDAKMTAKAEAVVSVSADGILKVERKGLRVKVS